MRTTLDLDGTVLRQLKERQRHEGKSLGQLASELLAKSLAETADASQPAPHGPGLVHLFWPVAMAYLRISTHPKVFGRPLEPGAARDDLTGLLGRAHVRSPGEGNGFWTVFEDTVGQDVIRGNLVTDSHIAALMRHHGVGVIWTADRDFRRFADITARDPYTDSGG